MYKNILVDADELVERIIQERSVPIKEVGCMRDALQDELRKEDGFQRQRWIRDAIQTQELILAVVEATATEVGKRAA